MADAVLLAVLLVSFLVFFFLTRSNRSEGYVEVFKDGKLVVALTQESRYELKTEDRHVMDIVFERGRVRVENSDCPLKICEKTGSVGPNGVIVCIPNKVVVRFVGKTKMDVMTW
ncbi:MAG: NusG domain II-containing protein [Pseudothermotoga sp.]